MIIKVKSLVMKSVLETMLIYQVYIFPGLFWVPWFSLDLGILSSSMLSRIHSIYARIFPFLYLCRGLYRKFYTPRIRVLLAPIKKLSQEKHPGNEFSLNLWLIFLALIYICFIKVWVNPEIHHRHHVHISYLTSWAPTSGYLWATWLTLFRPNLGSLSLGFLREKGPGKNIEEQIKNLSSAKEKQ